MEDEKVDTLSHQNLEESIIIGIGIGIGISIGISIGIGVDTDIIITGFGSFYGMTTLRNRPMQQKD